MFLSGSPPGSLELPEPAIGLDIRIVHNPAYFGKGGSGLVGCEINRRFRAGRPLSRYRHALRIRDGTRPGDLRFGGPPVPGPGHQPLVSIVTAADAMGIE